MVNKTYEAMHDKVPNRAFQSCRKFTSKHAEIDIDYVQRSLISKKNILCDSSNVYFISTMLLYVVHFVLCTIFTFLVKC